MKDNIFCFEKDNVATLKINTQTGESGFRLGEKIIKAKKGLGSGPNSTSQEGRKRESTAERLQG